MDTLDDYLKILFTDKRAEAKEWRGANNPVDGKDHRINWIGKCMNLEGDRMKIRCLRKLREQTAMNPFYQYRIDRFVDAITQTWEPTEKPGTIPGNEFKASRVGEDLVREELVEGKIMGHIKGAPEVVKWIGVVKMNEGFNRRKMEEYCKKQPREERKTCKKEGELKILQGRLQDLTNFKNGKFFITRSQGNKIRRDKDVSAEYRNGCNNPLLDKQVCHRIFGWHINSTQKKIKKLQGSR